MDIPVKRKNRQSIKLIFRVLISVMLQIINKIEKIKAVIKYMVNPIALCGQVSEEHLEQGG